MKLNSKMFIKNAQHDGLHSDVLNLYLFHNSWLGRHRADTAVKTAAALQVLRFQQPLFMAVHLCVGLDLR